MAGGGAPELTEQELAESQPRRNVEQPFLLSCVLLVIATILIAIWILFMVQSVKDNWYQWPLWTSLIVLSGFFVTLGFTIKRFGQYRRGEFKVERAVYDSDEQTQYNHETIDIEQHDNDYNSHTDDDRDNLLAYNPPHLDVQQRDR
jgi:flagellar biogenesis protein FliO